MIIQPTQQFARLSQLDRSQGLELKAYQEGSLFHSENELSLSEAAQKIGRGETVAIEEVGKDQLPVSYEQWGKHKEGVITVTQRRRTHVGSPETLEQFVHSRAGDAPSSPAEKLAARFQPLEGHMDMGKKELDSLAAVKSGFFGGKKLSDGPGLSAFEAAQVILKGGTVAFTQTPLLVLAEALIGGQGASHIQENMKAQFISAESDLDSLTRNS